MDITLSSVRYFFTRIYTRPSIKEIIAEDIVQAKLDVIQCKAHVTTYQFMQHMAEAKITALIAWERKSEPLVPYKTHPHYTNVRKQNDR